MLRSINYKYTSWTIFNLALCFEIHKGALIPRLFFLIEEREQPNLGGESWGTRKPSNINMDHKPRNSGTLPFLFLYSSGYTQSTCSQGGGPCEGFEKRWRTTTTSVRGV